MGPTVLLFLIRILYEIQPEGHSAGTMRNALFSVRLNLSFSKVGLAQATSWHPYKMEAGARESALQMDVVYVYFSQRRDSQGVRGTGLLQDRLQGTIPDRPLEICSPGHIRPFFWGCKC